MALWLRARIFTANRLVDLAWALRHVCHSCALRLVAAANASVGLEKGLMTAKGVGGRLELLQDRIRIRRKGLLGFMVHGLKGDKDILLSKIGSIQFRKPGLFSNGYIQFSLAGGNEAKGGIFDAAFDENTVMFKARQQQAFIDIKEAIEQIQMRAEEPASTSKLDELAKLASLRDKGIVSEEEFAVTKKRLLEL